MVYTTIISGRCTGCHGATHRTGLAMANQGLAYTNLFDRLCGAGGAGDCANGTRKRVVASNAAASTLVDKVKNATPACGSRMPLGGAALDAAQIKMIEDWINAGALNN